MSRTTSRLATGMTAVAVTALLSACGAVDTETPNPEGGAVTVPDQSETQTPPPAPQESPAPEDTVELDDGAAAVKPEVEGIGMDEAVQIALDEFGGDLDGIGSDYFDGIPVWEIELDDTKLGMDLEVVVDKETGEILHHEED